MSSIQWVLLIVGILTVVIFAGRLMRPPISFFTVLLKNLVTGCIGLFVIDYVGKTIGVHVPLNLESAGVAGILGVPGVAALAILQKWVI